MAVFAQWKSNSTTGGKTIGILVSLTIVLSVKAKVRKSCLMSKNQGSFFSFYTFR
jgi:hypothetical protein